MSFPDRAIDLGHDVFAVALTWVVEQNGHGTTHAPATMSDTDPRAPPRRLGSLALRWCGLAHVCVALALALAFPAGPVLQLFPVVATIVLGALLLAAAMLNVAAAALGLAAIYRGLLARGSAREALSGLLALALCVGGPVSAWYGSGFVWPIAGLAILGWAVLADIQGQPAPTARGEEPPVRERAEL